MAQAIGQREYDIPTIAQDGGFRTLADYRIMGTPEAARAEANRQVNGWIRMRQGVGLLRSFVRESDDAVFEQILRDYHAFDAPTTTETCLDCGDARSLFCPMSADGEGPHRIAQTVAATAADAAFIARYDIHAEQGARER